MNSGKSSLISEYLHVYPSVEFNPPPIKVTFEGLDFEFIDSVFAVEENGHTYNFYELDAPTIQKWYQFVEVASAVVIVYNDNPKTQYGTHDQLADAIFNHTKQSNPIIMVLNNFENLDEANKAMNDKYKLNERPNHQIFKTNISPGESFFDDKYGPRIRLDTQQLREMIMTVINSLQK